MTSALGLGVATIWDGTAIEARFPWMIDLDEQGAVRLAPLVAAHGVNGSFGGPWSDEARAVLDGIEELAAALERLGGGEGRWATDLGATVRPVLAWTTDDAEPPETGVDAYFRLHLLSRRLRRPHSINLDGIFGLLPINAWTDGGVVPADRLEAAQLDSLMDRGHQLSTKVIDRFPQLTDYVVPSGVRIADASRVRLGAHLAPGTTVMHEGFVNFNAGTLGTSMVEGRISAGVVVGADSDIGGGSSIMGTLSGGGKERITIGERCLLGANAGIGISLGDDCIVEAGLYVTAGMLVKTPSGETVKARELSGNDGLLFRRNSASGILEAVPSGGAAQWGGLNSSIHQND